MLDPDFGWRIKTGELILRGGIPKTDPFTYTMGSFPFVDHAWTQSVFMSLGCFKYGKFLLGLTYVFVALSALGITYLRNHKEIVSRNNDFYDVLPALKSGVSSQRGRHIRAQFIPALKGRGFLEICYKRLLGCNIKVFGSLSFLLTVYILSLFFGVRAQIVSWLMLAILLNFILKPSTWPKVRVFAPFFFFLWANLHGSFFLGLVVYLIVALVRSVKTKKIRTNDFLVLLASVFATLVNPYGPGIWREVVSSIMDTKLKWTIVEWMPALTMLNLPFAILVALSLVFVIKQVKIFLVEEVVLYFVFLLAAVSTRRHLPLWAIITLPLLEKAINNFYLQVSKIKGGLVRFKKVYKIAWIATVLVIAVHTILDFKEVAILKEGVFYPKDAVTYLNQHLPSGEIFSEYGWGGYLIWKLPEKKVFIDGRMPSWRWQSGSDFEANAAIDDYNDILKGKLEYQVVFDKYGIDTVLWSTPKRESPLDKFFGKIEKMVFKKDEEDFDFIQQLEKDGWRKVFEDNTSLIYKR